MEFHIRPYSTLGSGSGQTSGYNIGLAVGSPFRYNDDIKSVIKIQ